MTALPEVPRPLPDVRAPGAARPRALPARVRVAARARGLASRAGALLVLGAFVLRALPLPGLHLPVATTAAGAAGLALLVLGVGLGAASPSASGELPHPLCVPLPGRCTDLVTGPGPAAGPGTHAYGQAFALDLAHEDGDDGAGPGRTTGGTGLLDRLGLHRPEQFASFGQPVLAVADATVVRVLDGARDHRSRSTPVARGLLAVEAAVRELCGARAVLGNHVVLDVGGGRHAVCAHLQRGSVRVRAGDRVLPGHVVGAVGSSGSAARPHLRLQLGDHPRPLVAVGLPFTLTGS